MRKPLSDVVRATAKPSLRRRLAAAASFILLIAIVSGCNATTTAQDFVNVITGILNIAKAEIPALPAADGAIVAQWTTLGTTLDGQLQTCIASATAAGGKKAAFLACFNAFAAGIASPSELAQLRVLSTGSQSKVQLWVTAIILGVNAALTAFGGTPATTPQVADVPASHRDLAKLARQVGVSPSYGF
ncbi:MAG TPA: hypothetical protein VHX49_11500 [Candidatus Acidoferrales bacterium]|jgi:hypothetical protein|nr:hypothetical protein [Candidatus Acidoferrales bacterium]